MAQEFTNVVVIFIFLYLLFCEMKTLLCEFCAFSFYQDYNIARNRVFCIYAFHFSISMCKMFILVNGSRAERNALVPFPCSVAGI